MENYSFMYNKERVIPKLERLRRKFGVTQARISEGAGMKSSFYPNLVNNPTRKNITKDQLESILRDIFQISVEDFFRKDIADMHIWVDPSAKPKKKLFNFTGGNFTYDNNEIKELRKKAGLTQQDIARALNLHNSTVSCLERGVINGATSEALIQIKQYLQDYLAGDKPQDTKETTTKEDPDIYDAITNFERATIEKCINKLKELL